MGSSTLQTPSELLSRPRSTLKACSWTVTKMLFVRSRCLNKILQVPKHYERGVAGHFHQPPNGHQI
jgi:hypothetical protein